MGEKKVDKEEEKQSLLELFTKESNLLRCIELISSLVSLSYSIKVFKVKWHLIRNKLEELNSGLTVAKNGYTWENSALAELIPAIIVTVSDCYDLACRCVNLSFRGKLLMQSDLDVVSVKIEVHLKSLAEIYTAGIITHSSAIVVLKPSVGASRDDMKFYVRDLLTRLKIGGSKMKNQALVALNEVVTEDEKYMSIVVGTGEIITLLGNFLEFEEMGIQEESAKVIFVIAGTNSYKGVLVGAGIIASLIRVLESGSNLGRERAARSLQKLTENSDNAWSISAHGGVTTLLKICTNDGDKGDLISPASGVLMNLAGVEEIKRFMVEEGAVSAFIKLLRSKDEALQMNAIEFLQTMALGDEPIRQMIIKEGGIQPLVRVLDPKASFSFKARQTALGAIENFCFSSTNSLNILMGYGFLDQLLFFISKGEVSLQELAVKASFRLCGRLEETKKAMGDVGFMPELLRLLDVKSFEVREMAAKTLSSMVCVPRNRRRFLQEDCNVNRILQLLDPGEGKPGNNRLLLSTLMSLTHSNSGRRMIANSSYLKNLERLAEADIMDAKRIIKQLSTNRFQSIFNGIWNQ